MLFTSPAIDVLGQTTREKALGLLQSLYEPGKPVPSRIIAQRLRVSETRIWHILGDAKRAGLARADPPARMGAD